MLSLKIPCWKWTVPLSFFLKRNNCCCKNSFVVLVEEWFYSANIGGIIDDSLLERTVPFSVICVRGNGPMNSNSCLECFLRLTRFFSPTLYWWLFRRMFSRLLLWFIRNCLRCRMCSQSATCFMFKMESQPNTSCIGDACSVVW